MDINSLKQSLPELDTKAGLLYCAGNIDLYSKILTFYSDEKKLSQLNALFEHEDWDNYCIEIHSLKSNSRTVGLAALGDMAEKLEKAARDKDAAFIKEHHAEAIEQYDSAASAIRLALQK